MAEGQAFQPVWEHQQLAALLRRGWPAIVLGVIAGIIAGALLTAVQTKKYTAASAVFVTPTGVSDATTIANARTSGTINLDTESQLVRSTGVAQQVQDIDRSTKLIGLTDLIAPVTISVPANTQILTIQYESTSPATAAQRANDFAIGYLKERKDSAEATLDAQIKRSQTSTNSLTAQLKAVGSTIGKLPKNSSQLNFAQAQRSLLIGQISALNTQLNTLTTTVVAPGSILTKAVVPTAASSPSRTLNLGGGVAAGLLLGLVGAWIRFSVRRRLRRPDDVTSKLHIRVVGIIPPSGGTNTVSARNAGFDEYRRIGNIVSTALSQPGILLVTGQCTPIASTDATINLARALSMSGAPVAFTSTAIGADDLRSTLGSNPDLTAKVVPLPRPGQLNRQSLDALRGDGYLIVAAPDAVDSADAQTFGALSDAVVLVIEARSRTKRAEAVMTQLDVVGAPILGAILVPAATRWKRLHFAAKADATAKADVGKPNGPATAEGAEIADTVDEPNSRGAAVERTPEAAEAQSRDSLPGREEKASEQPNIGARLRTRRARRRKSAATTNAQIDVPEPGDDLDGAKVAEDARERAIVDADAGIDEADGNDPHAAEPAVPHDHEHDNNVPHDNNLLNSDEGLDSPSLIRSKT